MYTTRNISKSYISNMLIYNTLTGKKEVLAEPKKKMLKLFVCGPTVYDSPHLGHARTYIFFDVFARFLKHRGIKLFYLQNITDIDDKIIDRAAKESISFKVIVKKYTKEYLDAMKKLNIVSVDSYAPATKHIKEIIKQIKVLREKKHAYEIQGDGIYFDIKSFPEYGKLSRRTVEGAEDATSRIDESVNKKNKGDFALWKLAKRGEPSWSFRNGKYLGVFDARPAFAEAAAGKPGWHIEDTAITEKYFGPQYDMHGGATELKFPHHEAEIAQQESASGKKPMVRTWIHTGVLNINGKKMSKSLKNFVTISEFVSKFSANVLRVLTLQHHYRSPIDYSESLALQAQISLETFLHFLGLLKFVQKNKTHDTTSGTIANIIKKTEKEFENALEDDFNTPRAIAALFSLLSAVQVTKNAVFDLNPGDAKLISGFMESKFKLMGFSAKLPKIPLKIQNLAKKRELYRKNKQFTQSDDLRKKINGLGYMVEDTTLGTFLWPQKSSK